MPRFRKTSPYLKTFSGSLNRISDQVDRRCCQGLATREIVDLSLANQYRGRFSRSAKVRRAQRLPVAANGLDELITPVCKLNQPPASKRVILPEPLLERTLATIKQRSVSGTSLDSEIAIDRTSDSRPVGVPSPGFFPPMSDAHDSC